MFMTPAALELVRGFLASPFVSLGEDESPLTAESTLEMSDVSADMTVVMYWRTTAMEVCR